MPEPLSIDDFLAHADALPVIDVRTPAEFAQGHIPGADNLPLFSNEERAEIGTLYRQEGKDQALLTGLDRVGPKMRTIVTTAREMAPDGDVLVHCWRGGMRSGALAWLLEFAGMAPRTLKGGYKEYRRFVLRALEEPRDLRVLGGPTGAGKTDILRILKDAGEQVIDLEAIARHRGSVFGHLGMEGQPTQEQFENELGLLWHSMDHRRPVWIEDESRRIGRVVLPNNLYALKSAAPTVLVNRPIDERIERLVAEYGRWGSDRLIEAVGSIRKRLGGARTAEICARISGGDLECACRLLLKYYDSAYAHALERRGIEATSITLTGAADDASSMLLQFAAAPSP